MVSFFTWKKFNQIYCKMWIKKCLMKEIKYTILYCDNLITVPVPLKVRN